VHPPPRQQPLRAEVVEEVEEDQQQPRPLQLPQEAAVDLDSVVVALVMEVVDTVVDTAVDMVVDQDLEEVDSVDQDLEVDMVEAAMVMEVYFDREEFFWGNNYLFSFVSDSV